VEWNQLLFDVYIPQAWMCLLTTLVEEDGLYDVFRAWPPTQGNQNGDGGYWKHLPANLLKCIITSNARIWPVIAPRQGLPSEYLDLDLGSGSIAITASFRYSSGPRFIWSQNYSPSCLHMPVQATRWYQINSEKSTSYVAGQFPVQAILIS
jgi:hypothetical protein